MSNSDHYNNDGASKPSVVSRYKAAILILVALALSLLITFFLVEGFRGKESAGTGITPSTVVITSTLSATSDSIKLPISPLSPVRPPATLSTDAVADPRYNDLPFERGQQLYESGRYAEALESFSQALELDEQNPRIYNARGNAYAALGRHEEALADYSSALDLVQNLAGVLYNRGRVYMLLERYEEALVDLQAATEITPDDFGYRANGNIGLIYHQLGEYDKALAAFEASMSYDDTKADVFYLRGETYTALEDYQAAIADYEAAIGRFSDYDLAYQGLGYAYYKTDQYSKATDALERAFEISPDSPVARFYLALANLATGNVESADADISLAVNAFSAMSEAEQALIYTRIVADLEAFAQENPDSAVAVEAMIDVIPNPQ